jgi:hypothetical protein
MLPLHMKKAKLHVVILQILSCGSFKTFWDGRKYSDNITGMLKCTQSWQDMYIPHNTTTV